MSTRSAFEARIATILGICRYQFRNLRHEARDEATANTLGLCWKYYLALAERGKDTDAVFNSMVYHATRHTREGRMPQQRVKCSDVLGKVKRREADFDVNSLVGDTTPVPEAVAFRVDVPEFLATLGERNQGIAVDLASGMTTTEVARKYGVSPAAISQFRTKFRKLWSEFDREAA